MNPVMFNPEIKMKMFQIKRMRGPGAKISLRKKSDSVIKSLEGKGLLKPKILKTIKKV